MPAPHPVPNPDPDARHASPWTTSLKIRRVLWWIVQATLWRWSFHNLYGPRRAILRAFGATVSPSARVRPSVRIECPWNLTLGDNSVVGDRANLYALGSITLGDRVTVSQGAHLCAGTHDFTKPDFPLRTPPIAIGDDVWIAADAFVGPGVTCAEGALLGARGVAFKDLQPWTIYAGNPAQPLKPRPHLEPRRRGTPRHLPGT